ncbi:hypothetical protein E2C01_024468 [Portunus trituberculatus]|uniref:Uncharacterized protein n=1 Tax=Portunus trituberculatus TaxID=210409 RepID=A0A5B7ED90_PORTR|nr:hypothetical protein [Portunus trituberculatus]
MGRCVRELGTTVTGFSLLLVKHDPGGGCLGGAGLPPIGCSGSLLVAHWLNARVSKVKCAWESLEIALLFSMSVPGKDGELAPAVSVCMLLSSQGDFYV